MTDTEKEDLKKNLIRLSALLEDQPVFLELLFFRDQLKESRDELKKFTGKHKSLQPEISQLETRLRKSSHPHALGITKMGR